MRSVSPMRAAKTGYIVISALFIILGISAVINPELFGTAAAAVAGATMTVFGTVKLIGYFSKDLFRLAFQYDLAMGILLILLGVGALLRPEIFLKFTGVIFGLCILTDGLLKIQTALDSKSFGIGKWWLIMAAALASSAAGAALVLHPYESAGVLAALTGISLICEGAMNMITMFTAVRIVNNQLPDNIL